MKKIIFIVVLLVCLGTWLLKAWSIPGGEAFIRETVHLLQTVLLLSGGVSLHLAYFLSKLTPEDDFTKLEGCKWP